MSEPTIPDAAVIAFTEAANECDRGKGIHDVHDEDCCVRAGLVAAYPHLTSDLVEEIEELASELAEERTLHQQTIARAIARQRGEPVPWPAEDSAAPPRSMLRRVDFDMSEVEGAG